MKQNSPSSVCPHTLEFEGLKNPVSCLGFPHVVTKSFCYIYSASLSPSLLFHSPPRYPLPKDNGKRVLELCCLSWGHICPHRTPFVLAFSCSKLCFAQSFLKAVFIQCFHCGLQGHETNVYINLRHINFAPITTDKILICSKDTGAVCRSRMSLFLCFINIWKISYTDIGTKNMKV